MERNAEPRASAGDGNQGEAWRDGPRLRREVRTPGDIVPQLKAAAATALFVAALILLTPSECGGAKEAGPHYAPTEMRAPQRAAPLRR